MINIRKSITTSTALIAVVLFLLMGCSSTPEPEIKIGSEVKTEPEPEPKTEPEPEPKIVEITQVAGEWFENTMSDSLQLGYFYTGTEQTDIAIVEAEFKKQSGYSKGAFGLIFGYTATEDGLLSAYNRLEITVDGEYALYSVNGSSYTDLIEQNSSNTAYLYETGTIKNGYGSTNTLKVEQTEDGTWTCHINNTKMASGLDSVSGGENSVVPFFSVAKEGQEIFPDKPVQVSYRIVTAK